MTQRGALIFDMDGVLFLSADAHARAYAEVLAGEGVTEYAYGSVAGMRTDEAFRQILRVQGREAEPGLLARLTAAKQAAARRLLREGSRIAPGCRALLRSLKGQFRLALATSASRESVDLFLEKANVRDEFELILRGEDVSQAKPDPEIYLKVAEAMGLRPAECLVVEDSENGVRAAIAAGMRVYGVIGTLSREELESLGVARALTTVAELKEPA